ncbi:hypothetical protein WMY93_005415 [Mugilogobius chulae]|uniref:C-type lectin domain-containing protein n=1 Tax=Mugilogobius chulae TaxID=88201 RepID=A0AAW0PHU8_9GOBI
MKLERGGCPMFWYEFNGRCYKYVATDMTWIDAELHCVSQGANLVSIHNLEEHNFVKTLIQNFDPSRSQTYIGLTDYFKENAWIWSDGSRIRFTRWRKGEPNGSDRTGFFRPSYILNAPTRIESSAYPTDERPKLQTQI